jgi:uncharacterized membrane protein SpoIIM required for sporulation
MNKKILITSLISNILLLAISYIIVPRQLGMAIGLLSGFFSLENEIWLFSILYFLLLLPVYQITKLALKRIDKGNN